MDQANPKKRKEITGNNTVPPSGTQIPAPVNTKHLPFWNATSKAITSNLWLPTQNSCVPSPSNSWHQCFNAIKSESWFSARIQTPLQPNSLDRFLPLLPSISEKVVAAVCLKQQSDPCVNQKGKATEPPVAKKAKLEEEKPAAGKVRKIRLYPNEDQRKVLSKWFGTARWTYNQCVQSCTRDERRADPTKSNLRSLHVNKPKQNKPNLIPDWVFETPYDVRDAAMIDFITAFNIQKKLVQNGKKPAFEMHFRSKREYQSIVIHSKHWNLGKFYPTFFGKSKLRSAEQLPDAINYDSRLVRNKCGQYFLCLPAPLDDHLAHVPLHGVIALDPGVRTFMTGYDPSGRVLEIGAKDLSRIYRLCRHMDNLQSRFASPDIRARKRYRMKRAWIRLQVKIRNLIDEVHKKTTLALIKSYKTILLPKFETSQMVKRGNRKIRSKTARGMLTWAHYRFQQRLINKTREYGQSMVIIVDESYTSKTCGSCGHLHTKLGGNKVYACPSCGLCIDRDVNGARNILLKFLTDYPQSAP